MSEHTTQCCCEEKHEDHICELDRKGETARIRYITDDPVVTCLSCGSEANASEHVCTPVPIY